MTNYSHMLMTKATNPVFAILIVGLIVLFVPWSFAKLFSIGGSPEETGTTVHYRLKPVMRFLLLAFAVAGIAGLWSGVQGIRHGSTSYGIIWIVIGAAAIAMTSISIGREIILDGQGIHSHSAVCRETTIAWNDLSHVEKLYNRRSVTINYYIRSSQGTTIAVGDSSFNTSDLLQRIRTRHPLPERPYQRRKWYGG